MTQIDSYYSTILATAESCYSRSRTSDEGSSNDSDEMIQKKQKQQRLILSLRKGRWVEALRKAKISAEYKRFQQVSRVANRSGSEDWILVQ